MEFKLKKIEELNQRIKNCQECRLSETRINALAGEGNLNCRLMLIAQAPGENEDQEGRMFIGPSGKVLDELLKEAGIDRKEIYMTNLIKCMLPQYRKPKQDEIQTCSQYLDKEIELISPGVISPLGYYGTKYIFAKNSIPVPKAKSGFSRFYGELFLTQGKKVFPLPHPAALLYDNLRREEMINKYKKLKVLLADCKWFLACPLKEFFEKGKLDKKWIELYCKGDWESCVRYHMEEKGEPHPDYMLPDGSIDKELYKLYREVEK
jgi:DNA polymerase